MPSARSVMGQKKQTNNTLKKQIKKTNKQNNTQKKQRKNKSKTNRPQASDPPLGIDSKPFEMHLGSKQKEEKTGLGSDCIGCFFFLRFYCCVFFSWLFLFLLFVCVIFGWFQWFGDIFFVFPCARFLVLSLGVWLEDWPFFFFRIQNVVCLLGFSQMVGSEP